MTKEEIRKYLKSLSSIDLHMWLEVSRELDSEIRMKELEEYARRGFIPPKYPADPGPVYFPPGKLDQDQLEYLSSQLTHYERKIMDDEDVPRGASEMI